MAQVNLLNRLPAWADRLSTGADRALKAVGRRCWVVTPWRAICEAGLLTLLLLALVFSPMQSAPRVVIPATILLFMLLAGTLAGLRMRLFAGGWRGGLLREGLLSLPLAGLLGLICASAFWLGGAWGLLDESVLRPYGMALVLGGCIPAFLGLRVLARLWQRWNALRQRRFLWALTHAQLMVVVLVGLLLMLLGLGLIAYTVHLELNDLASLPGSPPYSVFMQVTVWLLGLAFLTLLLTGGGILFLFPLALLFAYLVGRSLARRVESLAQAAAHLREGDFSARVPVEGQDELAQLQADFNRMAADLQQRTQQLEERTRELQVERDRTAGLLNAHRQLAASVSHELRTPVATARTYLDALLKDCPDPPLEGAWRDITVVSGEVDRLERLIDDLFTLSRAEIDRLSLAPGPVALAPLLQGLVAAAEKPAWEQRRVQVTLVDIPPGLAVFADPLRLEQMIRNLLQNSLRHTPPGGYVLISASQMGAAVDICVEDSGEGIHPDDLPHIWDRFYRSEAARQAGEGSGLGLALVKELAEAMGGSVGVDSRLGEGSTFQIRLPQPSACDTNAT